MVCVGTLGAAATLLAAAKLAAAIAAAEAATAAAGTMAVGCTAAGGTAAAAGTAAAGTAAAGTTGFFGTAAEMFFSLGGANGLVVVGPAGWVILGSELDTNSETCTFDCWKPLIRCTDPAPSQGVLLSEILSDQRVKEIQVSRNEKCTDYPKLHVKNIWNEEFNINFFHLPSGELVAHADRQDEF